MFFKNFRGGPNPRQRKAIPKPPPIATVLFQLQYYMPYMSSTSTFLCLTPQNIGPPWNLWTDVFAEACLIVMYCIFLPTMLLT